MQCVPVPVVGRVDFRGACGRLVLVVHTGSVLSGVEPQGLFSTMKTSVTCICPFVYQVVVVQVLNNVFLF